MSGSKLLRWGAAVVAVAICFEVAHTTAQATHRRRCCYDTGRSNNCCYGNGGYTARNNGYYTQNYAYTAPQYGGTNPQYAGTNQCCANTNSAANTPVYTTCNGNAYQQPISGTGYAPPPATSAPPAPAPSDGVYYNRPSTVPSPAPSTQTAPPRPVQP